MNCKILAFGLLILYISSCQKETVDPSLFVDQQQPGTIILNEDSYYIDEEFTFIKGFSTGIITFNTNDRLEFMYPGALIFSDSNTFNNGFMLKVTSVADQSEGVVLHVDSIGVLELFDVLNIDLRGGLGIEGLKRGCESISYMQLQDIAKRLKSSGVPVPDMPDIPSDCELGFCLEFSDLDEVISVRWNEEQASINFNINEFKIYADFNFNCNKFKISSPIKIPILPNLKKSSKNKLKGELKNVVKKVKSAAKKGGKVSEFLADKLVKLLELVPGVEFYVAIYEIEIDGHAQGTLGFFTEVDGTFEVDLDDLKIRDSELHKRGGAIDKGDYEIDCPTKIKVGIGGEVSNEFQDKKVLSVTLDSPVALRTQYPKNRLTPGLDLYIDPDLFSYAVSLDLSPFDPILPKIPFGPYAVGYPEIGPINVPFFPCIFKDLFLELHQACIDSEFAIIVHTDHESTEFSENGKFELFINEISQGQFSYRQIDTLYPPQLCSYDILLVDVDRPKCRIPRQLFPDDNFCGINCTSIESCMLSFVDHVSDGKLERYKTTKIDGKEWFAENLRYGGNTIGITNESGDLDIGKYYTWFEVDQEQLCPDGWRIPSVQDWQDLMSSAGGAQIAGPKLKARDGWEGGVGTDDLCFSALANGYYTSWNQQFVQVGQQANFWTSNGFGQNSAHSVTIFRDTDEVRLNFNNENPGAYDVKAFGHACRCVRDVN